MLEKTTKEIIDEYFDSLGKTPTYIKKIRAQVDRPELYEYEKKLGKQIFEMNIDELFDMVASFKGNRNIKSADYSIGYNSITPIFSRLRDLFNFYINNYEVIVNPFYDKRMRGAEASKRLAKEKEPFTKEKMEEIIRKINEDYKPDRAAYIECLIRMFYDGFVTTQEIALLKRSDIDMRFRIARLPRANVHLSDKTLSLMRMIDNAEEISGDHGNYVLERWHGGFWKFIVRPNAFGKIQDKDLTETAGILDRMLITHVKNKYGIDVNLRMFYFLGFYEYLVDKVGEDRAYEMITSVRVQKDAQELMEIADAYGVGYSGNVSILKRLLMPYVKGKTE